MMSALAAPLSVLCVDDNAAVIAAVQDKLTRSEDFLWAGSLSDTSNLAGFMARHRPSLVLLDVDMPGRSSFDILAELASQYLDSRFVMFSGHIRKELVERAINLGAWGYISKGDGDEAMVTCLKTVAAGRLGFTPESHAVFSE